MRIIAIAVAVMCGAGLTALAYERSAVSTAGLLPFAAQPRKAVSTDSGNYSSPADSMYSVVVIAQRADCSGNLSHLAFLDRTSVAAHIAHRHVLLAGPAHDTIGLRELLPRSLNGATLSLLSDDQRELLHQLGHNETPTMALYDSRDRLLVLSATPSDVYARTVFVRALTRILTNNPTP
ncbi:MAG: hypothetical protein M3Y64_07535 [Gemmatimonadota bacterium]|nr:hypothetical protein [Gemmatimonadota bacterium]